MFCVDFTLLTLSLIAVFYYLSKQEKIADDIQAFKKEKCTLITILLIFDGSFIARVICNLLYSGALDLKSQDLYIFVIIPSFCDMFTICCILFFHMRNFKVIKAESLRTFTITDENSFYQSSIAHRETLVSVKVA